MPIFWSRCVITPWACAGNGSCGHRKERLEPFMCVSLEVTGKATILDSLDAFVAGEMLAGDNAFFCESCGKAVRVPLWVWWWEAAVASWRRVCDC